MVAGGIAMSAGKGLFGADDIAAVAIGAGAGAAAGATSARVDDATRTRSANGFSHGSFGADFDAASTTAVAEDESKDADAPGAPPPSADGFFAAAGAAGPRSSRSMPKSN